MFKSIEDAVKTLGTQQALNDLNKGYKNRLYRKDRNIKAAAMLDIVKSDDKLRAAVEARMGTLTRASSK